MEVSHGLVTRVAQALNACFTDSITTHNILEHAYKIANKQCSFEPFMCLDLVLDTVSCFSHSCFRLLCILRLRYK